MNSSKDVSSRIANYIEQKGIKQIAIAKAIGITPQAMSETLLGKRKLSADEYGDICKFLGVSYGYFFESDVA